MLPGGLPGNLFGYLLSYLITISLRRDRRSVKSIDYTTVSKFGITQGFLNEEEIPNHEGPTPETAKWVVPHRQISPSKVDELFPISNEMLKEIQDQYDEGELVIRQSMIEPHLNALFAGEISSANEVAHIHPKDGTFHTYLCPFDAKVVVEKGWGELHPLRASYQPSGLESVLIFAPQSEDEIKIQKKFIDAAVNANFVRRGVTKE